MFWIFSRKNTDKKTLADRPVLSPLYQGNRDLCDLTSRESELRVWLPATIFVALVDMAAISNNHRSDYLRKFFTHYLYGAHEFERMRQAHTGAFYDVSKHPVDLLALKAREAQEPKILESRVANIECLRGLGKNIIPLKIFLATKIKDDLQLLADKTAMPLSQFVREILISHLLGHTVWPERFPAWSKEQEQLATSWEAAEVEPELISGTDQELVELYGEMPDGVIQQ
ncbi:MAG: hypothetical protein HOO90_00985 [Methylotenera sp.]|uniref:hypothetical protein n=1 Tax=Methylotenera sp. TaxID=2051956 RepID=UPI001826B34C|nr:hypothetical protein [Methylotenera sp.]NOU24090.1 hypothetical protein [Methylotenera sp.]